MLTDAILKAIELVPEVKAHLSDKALSMLKSYDYYYRSLTHLVSSLYNGQIGGDFVDIMQNLIHGQLSILASTMFPLPLLLPWLQYRLNL